MSLVYASSAQGLSLSPCLESDDLASNAASSEASPKPRHPVLSLELLFFVTYIPPGTGYVSSVTGTFGHSGILESGTEYVLVCFHTQ